MFYIIFAIGILLSLVKEKKIIPKLYAIILTAAAAFRYGLGADYFSYERIYKKAATSLITEFLYPKSNHEIGFRMLESFVKQFGFSYQFFLAVVAAITIFFVYKASVKYSKNPTLSLVVYYSCYYLYWTYSALRQGIAMTVGIYFLLEAIRKGTTIKFLIVTMLLSLFHSSAIMLLFLYFTSKIPWGKSQMLITSVLAIVLSLLPLGGIIFSLSRWIPLFGRALPYLTSDYSFNRIFDFQTIGRFLFMAIVFVFYDSYCSDNPENRKILNMYLFSFILYFVFKFSELMAARLAIYGKLLDILILPNILYVIKSKSNRSLYAIFLSLFLFAYLVKDLAAMETYCTLIDNSKYMTVYVNIFNKDKYVFTLLD